MGKLHRNRIFSKTNADNHIDQSQSDGLKAYHEWAKPKGNHPPKKDIIAGYSIYNLKPHPHQSPPWYMLRKVESITIENARPSAKMTHDDYVEGYLKHRLDKWKRSHPEPKPDDIFYTEEHPQWVTDYEAIHDKIMSWISKKHIKKYNKKIVHMVLDSRAKESLKQAA